MESAIANRPNCEAVRQISVFADNRVGRLNELLQRFAAANVHILAFSQIDSTECSILRFIVDYPEQAREILERFNYAYVENDIMAVELNSASEFHHVTCALVEAEINIHYIYSFIVRPSDRSALAICLEDPELAAQVLTTRGIRVLDRNDITR